MTIKLGFLFEIACGHEFGFSDFKLSGSTPDNFYKSNNKNLFQNSK